MPYFPFSAADEYFMTYLTVRSWLGRQTAGEQATSALHHLGCPFGELVDAWIKQYYAEYQPLSVARALEGMVEDICDFTRLQDLFVVSATLSQVDFRNRLGLSAYLLEAAEKQLFDIRNSSYTIRDVVQFYGDQSHYSQPVEAISEPAIGKIDIRCLLRRLTDMTGEIGRLSLESITAIIDRPLSPAVAELFGFNDNKIIKSAPRP